MARSAVQDKDLGFKKILEDIKKTGIQEILVGIQEGSKTKVESKKGRKQDSGVNIAQYAAENEFGTNKIPERSFMRSTFDQKINEIEDVIDEEIALVIDNVQSLPKALARIGVSIQALVKIKIREIRSPPNSAATIAIKKSSKPLIDFGQMIAAVRYIIRRKSTK